VGESESREEVNLPASFFGFTSKTYRTFWCSSELHKQHTDLTDVLNQVNWTAVFHMAAKTYQ